MITWCEHVIAACSLAVKEVLTADGLNRERKALEENLLLLNGRIRWLVSDNARTEIDQEEYQREYDALAAEHEKLSRQMQEVDIQRKDKADCRRRIEVFLRMLEEQEECMRFEPYAFVALVDKVIVGQPRTLEFIFRNGRKYEYTMVD